MTQRSFAVLYRMLSGFLALCLLSVDVAGATTLVRSPALQRALPAEVRSSALQRALPDAQQPLTTPVTLPPAEQQALFRVTVALRQPRDLSRVRELGAVVLSAGESSALLLATAPQLADLARLRFEPTAADELSVLLAGNGATGLLAELRPALERAAGVSKQYSVISIQSSGDAAATEVAAGAAAELAGLLAGITAAQQAAIAPMAPVDTDNDGLTDTQEGWWCTDAANANSDGVGANDGAEVTALLNFTLSRAVRWGHGAPFGPPNPWPDFNNRDGNPSTPACNDGDYDTIPDFAEVYMVGSRVPEETTDLDKFDDGQELFGTTFCPGGTASCDYGSYPRIEYWNYIKASMPSWVQPPGDNPFVAAFPEPEVSVVAGSWSVEKVTTITTELGEMTETTNSYATTVTEGQGSSIADTVNWNNWEEVSESLESPVPSGAPAGAIPKSEIQPNINWKKTTLGAALTAGGGVGTAFLGLGALGTGTALGTTAVTVAAAGCAVSVVCALGVGAGAAIALGVGGVLLSQGLDDDTPKDPIQVDNSVNSHIDNLTINNVTTSAETLATVQLNQSVDLSGLTVPLNGIQFAINQQGQLLANAVHEVSVALNQPRFTETHTSGRSWGGAQTTTHEVYEEHAITNGQQFTTGQNWSTAWAVDSAHAADLRFTYRVANSGTEYFRELSGLVFSIYLGDETTPLISYPAWQQFANGKIENFFPADAAKQFASTPVPLTLEQMKRIDLGEKLTIVVENYSYGADENFYNDAINGGLEVLIEDGTADGDETVDRYVVPTWGVESVQDVLTRAFPATEDAQGNLIALKTAEFNGTQPPVWNEYALSDIAWWNVYQSCSSDCANVGATPLHEQPAQAGGSVLFRFNRDSDRDGYKDSVEWRYGTDPANPADHPTPEMLAGYTLTRTGNSVTGLLKLQNNGTFDAYGIDAVVYAPDDTITITNNTVGGNGRVRAGDSVAVGALIQPPDRANMGNSTAKVYAQGNYSGNLDRVYTFSVQNAGVVGAGNTSMTWSDGAGGSGVLPLGSAYHAPLPLPVANGLAVGLDSGTLLAGSRFSVQALIPRDTFKFTINSEPYTPPVVVVSTSDPQGSHRFVTPVQLGSLENDLSAYTGQMLPGVGLSISANGPFQPGSHTTDFILNSPDAQTIEGAKLYLDFVSDGKLVKEIVQTFDQPAGPTVRTATWTTADFNADYHPDGDNILLAFWTDAQDNIIDSAARPFNTFQDDPTAVLEVEAESLTWNFGAAKQGTLLQRPILIGNTGRQALLLRAGAANGAALVGPRTVEAGGLGAYTLTLDTTPLAVGPYSAQVTIRTSDPTRPTVTVNVSGTIEAGTADSGGSGLVRPLDWIATITGAHNAGEWVTYSHTLGPEPETLHPARVYSEDYGTFLGTGNYATDFAAGTAPGDMFGDGRDGVMPSSGNLDDNNGVAFGGVSGSADSTIVSVTDYHNIWRVNPGDAVLLIQTQATESTLAGIWEINWAISDFNGSGTFSLRNPLSHSFSGRAQIVRVPQYSSCNVTGFVAPHSPWNGMWGGIVAVMCNSSMTIGGTISANGNGFSGGWTGPLQLDTFSYSGEGIWGNHHKQRVANWNGGGGGRHKNGRSGGGGGGGNTTPGAGGWASSEGDDNGFGGNSIGFASTTAIFGGGGGGGGHSDENNNGGSGGAGGGSIFLFAKSITVFNTLSSLGANGQNAHGSGWAGDGAGGGGGAGGSIILRGNSIVLNDAAIYAYGGSGGVAPGYGADGGNGGLGSIQIGYCESLTGLTWPPASTQKLTCHIAEQVSTAPYTQGRLNIPATTTTDTPYAIQYARRLVHTAAGEQTSTIRVPAGVFNSATLHALVSGVGSGDVTFKLDVGNDGTWDWQATQNVSNAHDFEMTGLAAAFNAYWTAHGAPSSGNLDVPVRVYLSKPGQVLLTDLQMTDGGSSLRYVRLPALAGGYDSVVLALAVAGSGSGPLTLAADVGDDGTVDWSFTGSGPFPRALTSGDLSAAVNAYLSGKSGDVDVPVRLTYTPFNGITISRAAATPAAKPDGAIANADVSLSQTNLTEGDTSTVNATVRSNGAAIDGVTVGFFAGLPNGLDWYLGSRYLPAVSPSGTATSLVWDTTGFSGATTVKVVIDSYNALAETNEGNNQATKAATIKTRPNLRPAGIVPATFAPVAGEALTVDVVIQNNGQTPSAVAVCSLYVGNPDDGGALIGSQACGPLGANTSVTLTYPWTPTAAGPARLFARADSGNALAEPDEFDNDRWLDLEVTAPAVPTPPYAPSNPDPADTTLGVAVAAALSWSGGDPNPGDSVTYEVYFGPTNPPATKVNTQSTTIYDPPGDLAQNTVYFWQIVAEDNTNRTTIGPVWHFTTAIPGNNPPGAPSGPNPAAGTTGVSPATQVCWTASSDPDSDPVIYDVSFGPTNLPPAATSGQSATCYDPPGDLSTGTLYYWRVTARDNRGGGTPSALWMFTTATANNPPSALTNPLPMNAATDVAVTTMLNWSGSDPENDPLTYEVRFGTANPPPTVVSGQSAATYDPPGNLAAHTTYYWQIVAKDAAHPTGTAGPVWPFTTANSAPAAPSGANPPTGATHVAVTTQLCWAAATDADGDAVTYDVTFGTANPPPAVTSGQSATCFDPPGNLTADTRYYWRVTAKDGFGGATPGPMWSFATAVSGTLPDIFYVSIPVILRSTGVVLAAEPSPTPSTAAPALTPTR